MDTTIGYADHVYICSKCGKRFHGNGYKPLENIICPKCRSSNNMKIEDITKFVNDEDAWYLIRVPSNTSCDEMMDTQRIVQKSHIRGTFLIVRNDTTVKEITYHIKEMMDNG